MSLKIGDRVKMINCSEAEMNPDEIWIVRSEPWILRPGEYIVLLEGKIGAFSCECLKKVTV